MAIYTNNLNLTLPDYSERAEVSVLNENFQKLDKAYGDVNPESIRKELSLIKETKVDINQGSENYGKVLKVGADGKVYPENAQSGAITEIPIATSERLGGVKIGSGLKISQDGTASVDTADVVEKDNTKPITSAAVHTTVGNIEVLLQTI